MKKTAVILAGGKGTRLADYTKDIPKPMVQLHGKPVLQYQIELLKAYNFEEVWLIVNHLKDSIVDYFGDGSNFGLHIKYYEEEFPLGTTGGIKAIEEHLPDSFLVLYGDVIMDMDLDRLLEFHTALNAEASLVVHPNDHPYDSDLMEFDSSGRITAFHPKPHPEGMVYKNAVNAAVYVFNKSFLSYVSPKVKADFGRDIFPVAYQKAAMFAYQTPEYIKDMGTPDRVALVEKAISSGKVAAKSLRNPQKAIFLDRDGVINKDLHLIHKPEDFHLYDYSAEAIKRINQSEYLAIVVTNQSIIARNLTDLNGLAEIHKKMETDLGNERAFVDAIYFCPHHPDGGYPGENPIYKTECDCRKPKPGMLIQAAQQFNIDLSQSWMIGDSGRDIEAGAAAGCKTIGVRTGKGMENPKIHPDFFAANLEEAIDMIFEEEDAKKLADTVLASRPRAENPMGQGSDKKPFVINIAGNTRSGKSTLSKKLKDFFSEAGLTTLTVHLDHWILKKEDRKEEVDVFTNFRMPQLTLDVKAILEGNEVIAPGYKVHPTWTHKTKSYHYAGEDIVILEGIVALGNEELRSLSDLKVFKSIEPQLLRHRFEEFYRWKGLHADQIESLFLMRDKQEYSIIAEHQAFADLVL